MLKSFCENTSLHGFAYFAQPERHRVEKIFWIFSVIISFILTGILMSKFFLENQNNPIVIYKDPNKVDIKELNFPAISICPGMIYKTRFHTHIEYEDIKAQILSHEKNITDLNMQELKMMQILSLVARDEFMSKNFPFLEISMDDYMDIFNIFNQTLWSNSEVWRRSVKLFRPLNHDPVFNFQAAYGGKFGFLLKHSATQFGPCYTVNLPELNKIYNLNKTDPDLYRGNVTEIFGSRKYMHFGVDIEHQMVLPEYPVKASLEELKVLVYMNSWLNTKKFVSFNLFEYVVPNRPRDGLHVIVHDVFEVLSNSGYQFIWGDQSKIGLSITPELTKIDASLVDETPEYRNCYLPHERNLEFFKVYNKANCEHECWAKMTLEFCGCVQFFMTRNKTTKVCGSTREKCFRKVESSFEEARSACKCYDPCDNIRYQIKLVSKELDTDNFATGIKISASFPVGSVFATRRKLSYTFVDFLSVIGGLLGLFTGFSYLSGLDILYCYLVVPIIRLIRRNDSKVYPLAIDEVPVSRLRSLWNFFKEMLANSSIHSFKQIGADGKSCIERLVWLILFAASIGLSCSMMRDVFEAFRNKHIIMKYGSTELNLKKIPLPALTVIRGQAGGYYDRNLFYFYRKKYGCAPRKQCAFLNNNTNYIRGLLDEFRTITLHYQLKENFEFKNPEDYVELIMALSDMKTNRFDVYKPIWNGNLKLAFASVLTSTFFGITFNMMEHQKLLYNNSNFQYTYGENNTLDYPLKASEGDSSGLYLEFNSWDRLGLALVDQSYIIHSPDELPISRNREGLNVGTFYDISIEPEVVKADDDLRSLDLNIRKCYLDNERNLTFFKIYTQKNCEAECLSHIVGDMCSCVPFYYIRAVNTPICNAYSMSLCVNKLDSINLSEYDYLYETDGFCNCLPACNYIRYSYEVNRSRSLKKQKDKQKIITMKWKDSVYFQVVRYQETKLTDFFSIAGGILGFFAGISALSTIELFYFLTLRLTTDLIRYLKN